MNSIGWRVFFCVSYLLAIEQTVFAGTAFAQIYHVQEMNTEQIKALEREKTVVLLPRGHPRRARPVPAVVVGRLHNCSYTGESRGYGEGSRITKPIC